jgi:branched-chain amino acid transport system substrate-binding protein
MRKEEPGVSANLPWFSKNTMALGALALSVGVLAACSNSSSTTTTTPTSSAPTGGSSSAATSTIPAGPITIGASLSLTGDGSADGLAFQAGYNLWAKDVNAAGGILGHQVKVTILDDKTDPNQASTNYQTLINSDKVELTFGPWSSKLTTPSSEVAARNGYAMIEGAGGAPTVFQSQWNQAYHNVFDVSLPVADELMPFVNYIRDLQPSQRPKTAAFPMADDPFADPPVQLAQTKLAALGVKSVYSKIFPAEPSTYSSIANQVAATKADIVVLGSTDVPTVSAFMQVFEQQHYTPKLFLAASGPDQGSSFTSAVKPGNANGMMVPNGWYPGYVNAASQKMVAAAVKDYPKLTGGTASGVNADIAEAYSVGQVAAAAIIATGSVDNQKIIQFLHSGATLQTVQGPVKFDALGENSAAAAFIFQWQNGGMNFLQVLPAGDPASKKIINPKTPWVS